MLCCAALRLCCAVLFRVSRLCFALAFALLTCNLASQWGFEPSPRWLDVPFAAAGHLIPLVVRVRAEGLRACEMVGLYCAEAQSQAPRGSHRLPSDCTLVHKP